MIGEKSNQQTKRESVLALLCTSLVMTYFVIVKGQVSSIASLTILAIISFVAFSLTLLYYKKFFVLLLFFLVPLSQRLIIPGTGMQLSFPSELMITTVSGCLILYTILKGVKTEIWKHPLTIILLIDTLWFVITCFTSTDLEVSFKRAFMRINYILFAYLFMAHWFKDKKQLLKPSIFYIVGFLPTIYFILKKYSHFDFLPQVSSYVCKPYFDDHTIYAASLVFLFPIVLLLLIKRDFFTQKKMAKTILIPFITIVFLIAIYFSFSRAAWLSMVLGLVFFFLLQLKVKPKYYLFGLVTITALIFSLKDTIYNNMAQNEQVSHNGDVGDHITSVTNVSNDASNLERINRWVCAYRMFQAKPLFGFGPGTYQFEYVKFQTSAFRTYISSNNGDAGNAHNEYLTYLSESGLIGFLTFLSLVLTTLYLGIKNSLQTTGYIWWVNNAFITGLATYFFHGLFNAFIDQEKIALLVFSAIAVVVAIDLYHKNHKDEKLV